MLTFVSMPPRRRASDRLKPLPEPQRHKPIHASTPEPTTPAAGITGGQESIFTRVAEAASEAIIILEDLHPLGPDPDLNAVDELKTWIRSELMEILGELTLDPGPGVARIEHVFTMLLDQMGTLQDLMDDDEAISGFPALADQIASLYRSWNNMQQVFDIQLGIVAKQFGLVIEALDEAIFTLDATSLGVAERQLMLVRFETTDTAALGTQPMSLDHLLTWVKTFATESGPRAISEGGGFALRSRVFPAATLLNKLLLATIDDTNPSGIPAGLITPQVGRVLNTLAGRLDEVAWNC
jgi:hypothetical protein